MSRCSLGADMSPTFTNNRREFDRVEGLRVEGLRVEGLRVEDWLA